MSSKWTHVGQTTTGDQVFVRPYDEDYVTHTPEDAEKFQRKYGEPEEPDPWGGP